MIPRYQYLPMIFRGVFESHAAAMASVGADEAEIVQALAGAKAAGEASIVLHALPNGSEQIAPVFRVQPGPGGSWLWAGDRGYSRETREEAVAFLQATNPGVPFMVIPMLAEAGGQHA